MKLNVDDIVEFKKYEDMNNDERMMIGKDNFPLSGKVKGINVKNCDGYFIIAESPYVFSKGSVARVFSHEDDVDVDSLKSGDEVWVKTTVNVCYDDTVFLNPVERFAKKYNLKKVKHEEPECFIVKEDRYDLYIGASRDLVSDKDRAKIYESCDDANEEAADMHLNAWDVIPYDD